MARGWNICNPILSSHLYKTKGNNNIFIRDNFICHSPFIIANERSQSGIDKNEVNRDKEKENKSEKIE